MKNKISVIIPLYNCEKYITEAIGSVKRQGVPTEIIVADDGSTDGGPQIAEELGAKVLRQQRKRTAAARNAGFEAASGEYVLFLDSDDVLSDGALAALMAGFDCKTDVVFGKITEFISEELLPEEKEKLRPRTEPFSGQYIGCALLRRKVAKETPFDETLKTGEAIKFTQAVRERFRVKPIETVTMNRRLHMTNTGRIEKSQEMKDYAALIRERIRQKV
ncbi:MAG TPA: glycosyltransferase family 2 protein [Oscillospiraceae bacterium]|nr:glycosyltransferase family 2 protein [Oscillospiraceae bacterium]HPS34887.1 glycosyltransferase family 2 protein [Oscillospiraceae bacterium]